jgi:beta-mannosidase
MQLKSLKGTLSSMLLAAMAVLGTTSVSAQNTVLSLDRGWQFRQVAPAQAADSGWLPASVPGDVHLDLLANKKIQDPFYRDNEAKLQWIEKESWEYRINFDATPAMLAHSNVDLVFDGLDAAAVVYLNDTQMLAAFNMFRTWRIPVKGKLHAGHNSLRVVFPPPIKIAEEVARGDHWQPKTDTEPKTYIRKAAYEYGWDWGPRFVTSGIWRPVRLEAWNKIRIADFAIHQRDVSREAARIDAEVAIEASTAGSATVSVRYSNSSSSAPLTRTVAVHAGSNIVDIPIEIR